MFFSYNTQFNSIRNILTHACLCINSTSSSSNSSRIFIISTIGISLWNISTSNFVCALIISQITFIHNLILINLKVLTNLTFGSDLLFFKLFRYLSLLIIFWGLHFWDLSGLQTNWFCSSNLFIHPKSLSNLSNYLFYCLFDIHDKFKEMDLVFVKVWIVLFFSSFIDRE